MTVRDAARPLVVIASFAVVGGLAAFVLTRPGAPTPGPLQPNAQTNVEFALPVDQTLSWGSPLPANPTPSDIVLASVVLDGLTGLNVVGIAVCEGATDCPTTANGFPPDGVVVTPVEGFTIPEGGFATIVIGVELSPGSTQGRIDGLLVRYAAGSWEGDVYLPYSLSIVRG